MRTRMSIIVYLLTAAGVCLSASVPSAYGTMVYTRLIDTSYMFNKWYDYISGTNGTVNFNSTAVALSKLYTHNDIYTYDMTGTITFNPVLRRDYSSGGLAKGYFEGEVTVKVTGGLKVGGSYVYGGTGGAAKQILEATLTAVYEDPENPTLKRWSFEEMTDEAGRFDRTLFLTLVPGSIGLASGIQIGQDTLVMLGPKMDLSLKATVNPVNFVSQDLSSGSTPSNIKITGIVPEPMTAVLLGVGALLVYRRK